MADGEHHREPAQPDWRLELAGPGWEHLTLYRRDYTRWSPTWEHDHCAFCTRELAEPGSGCTDATHIGWATQDNYRWVCEACFADFHQQFGWVAGDPATPVLPRRTLPRSTAAED